MEENEKKFDEPEEGKKKGKSGNPNWVKGVSGNAGGRPATAKEFREKCREWISEHGLINLSEMALDPKCPHRFKAAELISAYAIGKPVQGISIVDEDGQPATIRMVISKEVEDLAK